MELHHYRRIFETAQDGIALIDYDTGLIIEANQSLINLLGFSKADLSQKAIWDLSFFKDIITSQEKFLDLKTQGYLRYENVPLEAKNGKKIPVEFVSSVYEVNGNKVIQCNIRDISERRELEEKLALEKKSAEAILASIGDAVLACDSEKRVTLFNRAAESLTGFPVNEVIGKHYATVIKFVREADGKPGNDFIAYSLETGKKTEMENHTLLIKKDGGKVPVADSAAPIMNLDGSLNGCVVVFRDVSYEREIDKAKTEFISLVSHQLRAPLGGMRWNIEALQEDEQSLSQVGKGRLRDALASNLQVIGLVGDLLNIARIEQNLMKPKSTHFLINQEISKVIHEVESEAAKKFIRITSSLHEPLPKVYGDPKHFQEVVKNLLSNAIAYTKTNGAIELRAQSRDSFMEIAVSDNGIGIPIQDAEKVFTKFYRSDKARKMDVGGSGLGLFIAKSYVDSWGGTIGYESKEGAGTTFHFTIPFAVGTQQ